MDVLVARPEAETELADALGFYFMLVVPPPPLLNWFICVQNVSGFFTSQPRTEVSSFCGSEEPAQPSLGQQTSPGASTVSAHSLPSAQAGRSAEGGPPRPLSEAVTPAPFCVTVAVGYQAL